MAVKLLVALALLLLPLPAAAQLFTPVVSRPFESAFVGAPQPFFTKTPAISYDFGGQGLAYNVPSPGCLASSCAAGSTTYRSDAVNFKASTFGTGFPYQLGFNVAPNTYCYTISISQPGPYIVTLWLGDTSTGGSWNVKIDGQVVGNVLTPNTGNFGTLAASASSSFNATLGTHIMCLAWATGDAFFNGAGDIVAWQGSQATAISCNIGPQYTGSLPAGLPSGWGCAANWDFGSATYANTATWLGCGVAGTSFNTSPGFQWYQDTFSQAAVSELPPCSISIANDGGVTALKMDWAGSSYDGTSKSLVINTYTHNNTQITDFPNGAYYEVTMRMSLGTLPNPTGTDNGGFWTWTTGNGANGGPIEQDFVLYDPTAGNNTTGGAFQQSINWGAGGPFYSGSINYTNTDGSWVDITAYHRFGSRVTTDGSTGIEWCSYLDGRFLGCAATHIINSNDYLSRHSPILQIGAINQNNSLFIQSVRVWSCENGQTQQCNGTILSGPP